MGRWSVPLRTSKQGQLRTPVQGRVTCGRLLPLHPASRRGSLTFPKLRPRARDGACAKHGGG